MTDESKFTQEREGTGTKEWAEHNYNIGRGCSHNCHYCYARADALRWGRIKTPEEWTTEVINPKAVERHIGKKNGVIMFPTTHDITPYYLDPSLVVLEKMLHAGNKVLVVSKPHFECIISLTDKLERYKEQILFRFTIGSTSQNICSIWEPGAPSPEERVAALKLAYSKGFQTSVCIEPMLSSPLRALQVVACTECCVTEKIWIGKMNKIASRVHVNGNTKLEEAIKLVNIGQTDCHIRALVRDSKSVSGHEKIEWKDSIKKVISHE